MPCSLALMTCILLSSCDNERKGEEVGMNDTEQPNPQQTQSVSKERIEVDREIQAALVDAQRGFADAQYALAKIYAKRVKNSQAKIDKVIEWCEKAAAQGHQEAEMTLAGMYFYGADVTKDIEKARKWFEAAAINGNIEA
ncbi:MAG: tetratricopeptide repeat protein, partial [Akkermansia sp.]